MFSKFRKGITVRKPNNGLVDYKTIIRGTVFPARTPVQVMVLSGDGKFYLQKDAVVKGRNWTADCTFGYEDSPKGSEYEITAVAGPRVKTSPVHKIENPIQSNPVKVNRK